MEFGNRISSLRKSRKMSQEKFANKIGVTRQTIFNWESNITKPNSEDLKKISEVLKIDINDLFCNDNKIKNSHYETNEKKRKLICTFVIIIFSLIFIISYLTNNYTPNNDIVGIDTIRCNYNESRYVYYVSYDKKMKIVNIEITGQIAEDDSDAFWLKELNNFVFSQEITEPNILIQHISIVHKENGGYCN